MKYWDLGTGKGQLENIFENRTGAENFEIIWLESHLCRTWALELTLNSSNNAANLNFILGFWKLFTINKLPSHSIWPFLWPIELIKTHSHVILSPGWNIALVNWHIVTFLQHSAPVYDAGLLNGINLSVSFNYVTEFVFPDRLQLVTRVAWDFLRQILSKMTGSWHQN